VVKASVFSTHPYGQKEKSFDWQSRGHRFDTDYQAVTILLNVAYVAI
jgi:hypothetical protein